MISLTEPFWREEPFSDGEKRLLRELISAHGKSVDRGNPSTVAAANSFYGSGSYTMAIASALLTIGAVHGPLVETTNIIASKIHAFSIVEEILGRNMKVPGWGGSFQKDGDDPIWTPVERAINEEFPMAYDRLKEFTSALQRFGKNIRPNPSAFTATTAIILRMPANISPFLFIMGRLEGWTKLIS